MSQNRVVVWWDAEADVEQWRVEVQQQNSDGIYEAARESADAKFPEITPATKNCNRRRCQLLG